METLKAKICKKGGKQRLGRGFSREELKKVGLSSRDALRLGIPVDPRRRTAHKENVNVIRKFFKGKKESAKRSERRKSKS